MAIPLIAFFAIAAAQAASTQKPAAATYPDLNGPYSHLGSLVMIERSGDIELRLGAGRWRIEMAKLPIHAGDCESSGDREMCEAAGEDPCVKCIRYTSLVAWDESRRRVFLGVATGTAQNKPWVLLGYDMNPDRVTRYTNTYGGLGNGVVSRSGRYLAYSIYGVCGACCSTANVEVGDLQEQKTAKVPMPHDPSERSSVVRIQWVSSSAVQVEMRFQKVFDCEAGISASTYTKTTCIKISDLQFR